MSSKEKLNEENEESRLGSIVEESSERTRGVKFNRLEMVSFVKRSTVNSDSQRIKIKHIYQ